MGFYLQSIQSEMFLILLSAFTIVEFSFFCYFIYVILPQESLKKVVPFIWLGFLLFAIIDYIFFSAGQEFDSFTSGIEAIIIILLCIYYLYRQLKGVYDLRIYSTFDFWIVISFLIYFCGTFFLYLMTSSMKANVSFQKQYFIINISFNILKNILLCVAMMMKLNDSVNQQKNVIPKLDDDVFFSQKN